MKEKCGFCGLLKGKKLPMCNKINFFSVSLSLTFYFSLSLSVSLSVLALSQECTKQLQAIRRWISAEGETTNPSPLIVTQTHAQDINSKKPKTNCSETTVIIEDNKRFFFYSCLHIWVLIGKKERAMGYTRTSTFI